MYGKLLLWLHYTDTRFGYRANNNGLGPEKEEKTPSDLGSTTNLVLVIALFPQTPKHVRGGWSVVILY
jgi:hypothetical protein